jgi:hypothetical protein
MGKIRDRYKMLTVKSEGKRPLGRCRLDDSSVLKGILQKEGIRV